MLEQHVIFESYCAQPTENWGAHELVRIRPKAIYDICSKILSHYAHKHLPIEQL